jgi:hypothetical protein
MVKRKQLDTAQDSMRRRHLSYRREQAYIPYIHWIRSFILFQGKRHPGENPPGLSPKIQVPNKGNWLRSE